MHPGEADMEQEASDDWGVVHEFVDDETLIHALVSSLETDPEVSINQYDTVTVFQHRDDRDPLVYDAADGRFWSRDEFEDSVFYAQQQATNEDLFMETLHQTQYTAADHDTISNFHYDSTGLRNYPKVFGVAADGEGFALARTRNMKDDEETYVMVKSLYNEDEPDNVETVDVRTVDFTHRELPSPNCHADNRIKFGRDYILRQHADKPGEACATFEQAYKLEPTTRL